MPKLVWDNSFRRAFKKLSRNNPSFQEQFFEVLEQLAIDPFQKSLKTHKLSGKLKGLWACWVEHDCRIIFAFTPDPSGSGEDLIVLVDIGSHDEVY